VTNPVRIDERHHARREPEPGHTPPVPPEVAALAARGEAPLALIDVRSPDVMVGRPGDAALTDQLLSPIWTKWGALGKLLFLGTAAGTGLLFVLVAWVFREGIGLLGNNIPVAWAFPIVNFVWWIGIGHAGTFISAFLLLLEQRWRTSINRIAEAMTIFAVMQAGLYPVLHLGRPWFAYWLVPYPATMGVWPQFRSALPWDFAAVSTYFTVSVLFWYLGLVPDLAAARDRAPERWRRKVYGVFALGWRGSARDWNHYRIAYGLLAGLATPLVISVHSVVSSDFAITQLPGWHSLIFPPYFVAGALFSGFAMVLTLTIPVRRVFKLENVITARHLDHLAKMVLLTGSIVAYSYAVEMFMAWYGANPYDRFVHLESWPRGPYAALFWIMVVCNVVVPQLFWSASLRRNVTVLFIASLLVNVGMWAERFMIIVGSLAQDWLPSSWQTYAPTWVDIGIFFGTISFFLFLFLAFLRWVPIIPAAEVKELRAVLSHEEARPA
jgi:Ni/Fe-hydrogenase subunit HybB-like protein